MNIPTRDTGNGSITPIGDSFLCIETNSNNFGPSVFGKFERTVLYHFSKISWNRL